MIRVLHVFHEMSNGGIEHFVMDYYRNIDRSCIQFDFLVSVDTEGYFDAEIKKLGGKIYHAYPFKKNPIKNFFDIAKIVKENNYQIIHRHTGSAFGYFDLKAAKFGGAKGLIMHSHNNQAGNMLAHNIANIFLKVPCHKLACSKEAGEWLFGKDAKFSIVNNAINGQAYEFDSVERIKYRKVYGLSDSFVIGHVGRFEEQKNHHFLLQIFQAILNIKNNAVLVLVGDGSLMSEIKSEAKSKGIINNIIFMGSQQETSKLYNLFDVFVLPSKYEGFGITLLEAQTNGLCCFASAKVVPQTVNITGNVKYISLEEAPEKWADEIVCSCARKNVSLNHIRQAGFDISENAKRLLEYYKSLI